MKLEMLAFQVSLQLVDVGLERVVLGQSQEEMFCVFFFKSFRRNLAKKCRHLPPNL